MKTRIKKLVAKWNITKKEKMPYKTDLTRRENSAPFKNITEFRSLVMTMRYLGMTIKPEILFVCSYLSTLQVAPTVSDYECALHVMRYLYGCMNECMYVYGIGENPIIRVYADSAYQIHRDLGSHGGTCIFVGGAKCSVFSTSGKIRVSCNSSTDAELIEWEASTFLGDYFHQVLEELGIESTVIYMQDNDSASSLGSEGTQAYDRKRKHLIRCINSIKEYLDESGATVEPILTSLMVADILTKNLEGKLWVFHKKTLYGWY
jgi:hypothetical protein